MAELLAKGKELLGRKQCNSCNKELMPLMMKHDCKSCGRFFCSDCLYYALPEGEHGSENMHPYCWDDFKTVSIIDFSKPYSVYGPEDGQVLLFVHGEALSRESWYNQIEFLSKDFRCVSLDLPGHGSRVKETLTFNSAERAVLDTINEVVKDNQKVIYIGYSLGAYLGFGIVGRNHDKFSGAVLCSVGQNTGSGASLGTKLGVEVIKWVSEFPKQAVMLSFLKSLSYNHNIDEHLVERALLRPGIFFEHEQEAAKIFQDFQATELMHFNGPVLFINGEKDHNADQEKWRDMLTDGQLVVLEGADRFFAIDKRFVDRFNTLLESLIDRIEDKSPLDEGRQSHETHLESGGVIGHEQQQQQQQQQQQDRPSGGHKNRRRRHRHHRVKKEKDVGVQIPITTEYKQGESRDLSGLKNKDRDTGLSSMGMEQEITEGVDRRSLFWRRDLLEAQNRGSSGWMNRSDDIKDRSDIGTSIGISSPSDLGLGSDINRDKNVYQGTGLGMGSDINKDRSVSGLGMGSDINRDKNVYQGTDLGMGSDINKDRSVSGLGMGSDINKEKSVHQGTGLVNLDSNVFGSNVGSSSTTSSNINKDTNLFDTEMNKDTNIGTSGFGTTGFGTSGFGTGTSSGLGTTGIGTSSLAGSSDLGYKSSGLGSDINKDTDVNKKDFGTTGFGSTGFGSTGYGTSDFGTSGFGTSSGFGTGETVGTKPTDVTPGLYSTSLNRDINQPSTLGSTYSTDKNVQSNVTPLSDITPTSDIITPRVIPEPTNNNNWSETDTQRSKRNETMQQRNDIKNQ